MKATFRDATPDDRQFIVSTWSASYKNSHYAGLIQSEDWADVMHRQVEKVLSRPGARTLMAHEDSDPLFLYGWIAGDMTETVPVVFYAYVKEAYRRMGIARGLFDALGIDVSQRFVYSCRTRIASQLASKIPAARFDPLQARYPRETRRRRL